MTSKGSYSRMSPEQKADHIARGVKNTRKRIERMIVETVRELGGKCAECGEARLILLTVDHVYDDGADHRRSVGRGSPYYKDLLRVAREEPGRLQLLCANCHVIKTRTGYRAWPHPVEWTEADFPSWAS